MLAQQRVSICFAKLEIFETSREGWLGRDDEVESSSASN